MCGRVTLTKTGIRELASDLEAELAPADEPLYRPRYNGAPSELHWMVEARGDSRVLLPAFWGYVASARPLINVRGEQVASGSGFKEAFRARRCAIVTDGFFEWTKEKSRQPFWFHRPDHGLVLLAGLFQPPTDDGAQAGRPRFTILTTRPNRVVAAVHDRMPVVLERDVLDDWLAGAPTRAATLIAPAPEDALVSLAVSKRVNSVKNDDPGCLAPAQPTPPARQGSLF
jgi:putative SOS response-associated peptidase YedK